MISWGGTSMVTVLRSILTILSTNGSRMNRPGPLAPPCTRPRRKITPRSYSFTILMALSMSETTAIATITKAMNTIPAPTACNKPNVACIGCPPLVLALRVQQSAGVGPLHGYHLHRPSFAESYHGHLAPHPYHRLTVPRIGFLRGERPHGPPPPPRPPPPPPAPRPADRFPPGRTPARPATARRARTPNPRTPPPRGS